MVIVCPYFSPDPSGPKYEECCRHKLIRPHQLCRTSRTAPAAPHRTSCSPRACASITFELTLAPTMLCIHLVFRKGSMCESLDHTCTCVCVSGAMSQTISACVMSSVILVNLKFKVHPLCCSGVQTCVSSVSAVFVPLLQTVRTC